MLLTSHSPVVVRGIQPFFSTAPVPAADTPHRWSASTWPISSVRYAREAADSSESVPDTACSSRTWSLPWSG